MIPHRASRPWRRLLLACLAVAALLVFADRARCQDQPSTPTPPGQDTTVPPPPPPDGEAPAPAPKPQPPASAVEKEAQAPLFPIHGFLSARYRFRATPDVSDQDLYGYLSVDMGDVHRNPVTAHLLLRGTADIDGNRDHTGNYAFDSITDTYDSNLNGRFYYGYVDVHVAKLLTIARFGRQLTYDTPAIFHFDGARLETREFADALHLQLGAYGGVPVHFFESSRSGDELVGAYAAVRPWTGARFRGDYTHVRGDERLGVKRNDLTGVTYWQNVGEHFHLKGSYSALDGSNRDVEIRGTYLRQENDFTLQVAFYELLSPQQDLALELDPFYEVLGVLRPYRLWTVIASKSLGEHGYVTAGFNDRSLVQGGDESSFNHEFRRAYVTPALRDWPWKGFEAEVTGDYWEGSGHYFRTISGQISQKLPNELRVAVGTSYSLYKYDLFLQSEQDHVRDYYIQADWRLHQHLRLRLGYDYEKDPFDEYHTVDTRVTVSF